MAVEEMEEVGGDGVVVCLYLDAAAVVCEVVPVEEDAAERGHEAVGDEEGGGCGVGLGFGLDGGEHGDADAEDVHGVRGAGDLLEGDLDGLRKAAQAAQALLVVGELGAGGEVAVEEEVGDFFELAVGGEREDVVAAVVEVVAVAADGAEGGVAGGDSGEGYGFFGLEGGGFGHDSFLVEKGPGLTPDSCCAVFSGLKSAVHSVKREQEQERLRVSPLCITKARA